MERRVILIIMDSVGIGAMEDAYRFGDEGSNTLKNTAAAVGGLYLPNLASLGLGNIDDITGVPPVQPARACYGKMAEKALGKDTTSGHWEMMGLVLDRAFPTYPQGFPASLIQEFEQRIGRKTIGNKAASGTVIIEELGREHLATGAPIVYTSADSVFQIAAHEDVIPVEELYRMCRIARELLQGEHAVGRVIARPFIGEPGHFIRTARRHDFSLPPSHTILDDISAAGLPVIGVGKIYDIFAGKGISRSLPSKNNDEGINQVLRAMEEEERGLIFVNLLDFDQQYGHRNDPQGYAQALEQFDRRLQEVIDKLRSEDMLCISADHGCDPTTPSTDHSREYVPLLVYGEKLRQNVNLGTRQSFADLGQTIAEYLDVKTKNTTGESFYPLIR